MTRDELEQSLGPGALRDLEAGIRCQAEHDANLLADALDRISPPTQRTQESANPPSGKMLSLMLLTAAALRHQQWCDEGHDRNFTSRPPDLAIVREIMRRLSNGTFDDSMASLARKFAVDTQVFWMRQFSRSARPKLGVDIVTGGVDLTTEGILQHWADFLWTNRQAGPTPEGGKHGST